MSAAIPGLGIVLPVVLPLATLAAGKADERIRFMLQSKFYEISYAVPQELVKGKQTVRVKFVAHGPHTGVGPVSGTIRMVRS